MDDNMKCSQCNGDLGKKKTSFTGLIYKKCQACKKKTIIGERKYILPLSLFLLAFFVFMYLEDAFEYPRIWSLQRSFISIFTSTFYLNIIVMIVLTKILNRRNLRRYSFVGWIFVAIVGLTPMIHYKLVYGFPEKNSVEMYQSADSELAGIEKSIVDRQFDKAKLLERVDVLKIKYKMVWADNYLTTVNGGTVVQELLKLRQSQLSLLPKILSDLENGKLNSSSAALQEYVAESNRIAAIYQSKQNQPAWLQAVAPRLGATK